MLFRSVPLAEDALAAGAPQLHDNVPGNLPLECEAGDEKAVAAAFAQAAHITRLKVESTRVVANPLELRACLVAFDAASGAYRFNVCTQGTTMLRRQMSAWTNVPEDKLIFESQDVGGGFGQRTVAYPEYCALMLAAKATGKPVKWVATRVECFLCDTHGRSNIIDGALALDAGGKFLAMRLDWINDMGAYLSPGAMGHIRNTMTCMTGVYKIPALYANYRVALTNATPIGSYRGAGRLDIATPSSASSTPQRANSTSIRPNCAAATSFRPKPFPTRRRPARPTKSPICRACCRNRSSSPTGTVTRNAVRNRRPPANCAASAFPR